MGGYSTNLILMLIIIHLRFIFNAIIFHFRKTSAVIETASSKRKIVNLEDNSGEIEIKLWGNKIDLIKEQGATVTLKELRADIYNSRYSLNSTPSTTIEVKLHN